MPTLIDSSARPRFRRTTAGRAAAVVVIALTGALAGCGDDDEPAATGSTTAATSSAVTTDAATTAPAPAAGGSVTRAEAGAIAVARVGGVVNTVEPETDYGARWEVGVYLPDEEYTVYVGADGTIVRVDGPFPRD